LAELEDFSQEILLLHHLNIAAQQSIYSAAVLPCFLLVGFALHLQVGDN
jgi:hypothetical protein